MKEIIESAWENRELLKEQYVQEALNALVHQVDEGKLRCAEPSGKNWIVNDWVKKGIILFLEKCPGGLFLGLSQVSLVNHI